MALGPTPLPPLAEQKRIVAKVDQLMKLCDELEERQQEREKARLAMNKSCLNALTSPEPCSSRPQPPTPPPQDVSAPTTRRTRPPEWAKHFRRISNNFDILYDTPETVAELRKSILQLAVMGRLVPQYPTDEPAGKLLKKITAEKAKLVKEGKIKPQKPLPPISKDEMPYKLPDGWEWVRLGRLMLRIGSGSTPRGGKSAYVDSGIPFLRSQNIWDEGLQLNDVAHITDAMHEKMKNTKVFPGDILLNITGASLGRCAVSPKELPEANVSQHVSILRPVFREITSFSHLAIRSPLIQILVWSRQVGMAREGLSKKVLELFEFPLPPLAEQKRIVAKVDQLMKLCDELEAKLKQSRTDANSLIAAIVNHLTEAA